MSRHDSQSPVTVEDTLYERLGGQDAIDAVVEEFYDRVLADDDLQPYFADTDTDELRAHQKAFISYVAGGEEAYDGPGMGAAHDHLNVTAEAFGRVAEHLDASLRACGVDDPEREGLLSAVADLQDDVVTA
ncbi:group I truncated hemoglobin [Halosimplex salinum]|uniref:group I truncated hemoglobin n=1 Tax=Halosimplex salinum TaxID=1710538 RepID=UPI000F47C5C6|nr:group 1 truncated hemoglobin [Halosimplex salinum]